MPYDMFIFDLDGTLSDPKEGIVHSTNYALAAYGYEALSPEAVEVFIGPPLDDAFRQITGLDDADRLAALITKYREDYARRGYAANSLYPGIASVLETLAREGIRLSVCTSKRVDFAEAILKLHRIWDYFDFVDGGDVGIRKWQQLQALLGSGILPENSVMIGDRDIDLVAAHQNGLDSAGVLWGYGSREELLAQNPTHLLDEPAQLVELVRL